MFNEISAAADGILEEIAVADHRLRSFDKNSYPREAHHVGCIARALRASQRQPILEADYWKAFRDDRRVVKPRVDVWCPQTTVAEELWIELKVAAFYTDKRKSIGLSPVGKALRTWADDVYRLAALSCNGQPIRCAFIISHFGNEAWKPDHDRAVKNSSYGSLRQNWQQGSADSLSEILQGASICGDRLQAVDMFVTLCKELIPQCEVNSVTHKHDSRFYGLTVVEWSQTENMTSEYTENWPS